MPCGFADRGSSWRRLRRPRDVRSDEVPHKRDGRVHRCPPVLGFGCSLCSCLLRSFGHLRLPPTLIARRNRSRGPRRPCLPRPRLWRRAAVRRRGRGCGQRWHSRCSPWCSRPRFAGCTRRCAVCVWPLCLATPCSITLEAPSSPLDECALLATPTGVAPGVAPSTPDLAPAVAAEGVTAHHSSSSQPIHLPGGEHGLEQLSPCKRVI